MKTLMLLALSLIPVSSWAGNDYCKISETKGVIINPYQIEIPHSIDTDLDAVLTAAELTYPLYISRGELICGGPTETLDVTYCTQGIYDREGGQVYIRFASTTTGDSFVKTFNCIE